MDLCVVTETWLYEGSGLLLDGSVDLQLGEGIGTLHCGRSNRRGGGVGIFYRSSRVKVVDITPEDNPHEICVGLCSLRGTSRKVLCLGAYLSTALDRQESEQFLEYINDLLNAFKSRYKDLHIVVAGDWNQSDTDIALEDFPSIYAVPTPPTRGDEVLDIVFTNMHHSLVESEVCPPPGS